MTASLQDPEGLALELNEDFSKHLKSLKGKFLDNVGAYLKFIDLYGTHFMDKVDFGGRIVMKTISSVSTYTAINEDIMIKGGSIFHAKENITNHAEKSSYQTKYNSMIKVYGGNPDLIQHVVNDKMTEEWEKTVAHKPIAIRVTFLPITELIEDKQIKKELASAIFFCANYVKAQGILHMQKTLDNEMNNNNWNSREYYYRYIHPDKYDGLEDLKTIEDYTKFPNLDSILARLITAYNYFRTDKSKYNFFNINLC